MNFEDLTDEQKAKARECKTPEDVLALAKEEGYELSEEELADQGIYPGTIRLSIGTEHIDDIIADLEKGFAALV